MTKRLQVGALLFLISLIGSAQAQPIQVAGAIFGLGNHASPAQVESVGYEVTSA